MTESLLQDEQTHLNAKIADLELAASKREYGAVWQIVNIISGPPRKPIRVRKLDGILPDIDNDGEIVSEWRSYFETLLNNKNVNSGRRTPPSPSNSAQLH